jgi:uncharacterized protein YbjT (DUF2867 family)
MNPVFITGGTGYMGKRLIRLLLKEGYPVKALVRKQSAGRLPEGCSFIVADPFDASSFAGEIPRDCIFIQLLGVSHPGPKKKALFQTIDLASVKASVEAAVSAGICHFIYLSVAQFPTSIMKEYQSVRAQGESMIAAAGLRSTFIRPWYVIGPGHYWPLLLLPLFLVLEHIPATAQKARALRLVTLKQMLETLMKAVRDDPPAVSNPRIIETGDIRKQG